MKDKALQKLCCSEEFCTFLHFLHCKFALRKYLKDFSALVLRYGRPSKKYTAFSPLTCGFGLEFQPAVLSEGLEKSAGWWGSRLREDGTFL